MTKEQLIDSLCQQLFDLRNQAVKEMFEEGSPFKGSPRYEARLSCVLALNKLVLTAIDLRKEIVQEYSMQLPRPKAKGAQDIETHGESN